MPKEFGIATKERHIDLVMNVAYFEEILLFIECHADFSLVFQFRRTVFLNRLQHLTVFARTTGTVKHQVFEIMDRSRKLADYFR